VRLPTRAAFQNCGVPRHRTAALALLSLAAAFCAGVPGARADDSRRIQEIVFDELQARTVGDKPFVLIAHATSGLPVALEVVAGPAILEKRTVTLTGDTGIVIIRASQEGNEEFRPSVAERAFTVHAAPQAPSIVSGPTPASAAIGDTVALEVRVSGEPAPALQWRRDGAEIAGAVSSLFSIPSASVSDAGSYDVVATNSLGRAVSAAARVTVAKRRQTISFQAPPGSVPAGQAVSLSASASSGLPVQFSVVSGPATLSGGTVNSSAGTVVIEATQQGDSTYEAAMPVAQTLVFSAGGLQH